MHSLKSGQNTWHIREQEDAFIEPKGEKSVPELL